MFILEKLFEQWLQLIYIFFCSISETQDNSNLIIRSLLFATQVLLH